ncbi:MAG: helix-turn-helix transcriptional regulator [Acidimicrobiia bacterium]|nr:helix-turn-helix transcriptional regulator [Acidimicrobiia bacterium]
MRDLGSFIRDQRRAARLSLRKLSDQAGISNPYLSQIERGLRKPSAEILQSIARALRISAETLYVRAGILEERDGSDDLIVDVMRSSQLTERQKQVIVDIYRSFVTENQIAAQELAKALGEANGTRSSPLRRPPRTMGRPTTRTVRTGQRRDPAAAGGNEPGA